MIEIDGAKLRRLFELKGVMLSEASRQIGFDSSFISRCCQRNGISPVGAKSLEMCYGIQLDDYKKIVPAPFPETFQLETPEAKVAESLLDYERLWKVIYTAVREAMKAKEE